jgi:hypothetical protein
MSQSRRSGRPLSRPPVEKATPPVPSAGGRGWGYNLDYFLPARFGWLVPAFARRLLGGTDDGRADCRDVAHRSALPRDRHRAALDFASTFWLVLVFGALAVFALVVTGIGIVDHQLLRTAPIRAINSLIIGSMGLSMIAALIAGTRKRWLDDPVVVRHSRREIPGLANPKPYDLVISLVAGVLAALAFWAGVQDGISGQV